MKTNKKNGEKSWKKSGNKKTTKKRNGRKDGKAERQRNCNKTFIDMKIKSKRLTHSKIAEVSKLNRGLVFYYDKKRPEILYEKTAQNYPPNT